jgi:hypothetical protein
VTENQNLDPEDRLWTMIDHSDIGCVVYPAAEIVAPGHIQHIEEVASASVSPMVKSERVLAPAVHWRRRIEGSGQN